jgi:hypothetical protein
LAIWLSQAAYGGPLFQITGSYFGRADDGARNLQTGGTATPFTASSSYTLPDVSYNISDQYGLPLVTASSLVTLIGSATPDIVHLFGEVQASVGSLQANAVAYADATFNMTDTITPQSDTLAINTPVVMEFTSYTNGTFAPVGPCQPGQRAAFGISSIVINPIAMDGCSTTSTITMSTPRDVTMNVGVPFTFTWSVALTMQAGAGPADSPGFLLTGDTFEAIHTMAMGLQP